MRLHMVQEVGPESQVGEEEAGDKPQRGSHTCPELPPTPEVRGRNATASRRVSPPSASGPGLDSPSLSSARCPPPFLAGDGAQQAEASLPLPVCRARAGHLPPSTSTENPHLHVHLLLSAGRGERPGRGLGPGSTGFLLWRGSRCFVHTGHVQGRGLWAPGTLPRSTCELLPGPRCSRAPVGWGVLWCRPRQLQTDPPGSGGFHLTNPHAESICRRRVKGRNL